MFVSVDKELLKFCHKHPDHSVLNGLVHIELPHCRSGVYRVDIACTFPDLTDLDLTLLYRNSTGHKFTGFSRLMLVELVLKTARAIPESDVVAREVLAQAACIGEKDRGAYRYEKGAQYPTELDGFDVVTALQADPEVVAAVVIAEDVLVEPVVSKPEERREPVVRTSGGKIWDVMDAEWTAAGKPTDLKVVLALRKQAMDKLETEYGVKRTTASSSLGGWQKVRLI